MQVLFEQRHSITQSVPGTMLEGWAGWYDLSKLNMFMLKSWDWGETAGGPAEDAAHSKAGTVEGGVEHFLSCSADVMKGAVFAHFFEFTRNFLC